MVYLSYYKEYPIYEPAEGGYYYAGIALVESERLSKRQAKKRFDEEAMELEKENTYDDGGGLDGNWYRSNPLLGRKNHQASKYIGEGAMLVVEKRKGMYESGRQPYC